MSIFKLSDCDFFVTIRGTTYTFDHVVGLQIESTRRNRLTRGGNATDKVGISFSEGMSEADTVTLTVIGMPVALHNLLKDVWATRERVGCGAVSRVDGSIKPFKNCILAVEPRQLSIDETAESMNTALEFETFDGAEVHKELNA